MIDSKKLMWDECDENEWFNARERERLEAAYRAEWAEECEERDTRDCNPDWGDGLTDKQLKALEGATWRKNARYIINEFISWESGRQILEHRSIAAAWAMESDRVGPPHITAEEYFERRNWYEEKIIQAIFDEKLEAEVSRRNHKGVMKIIPQTRTAFEELRFDREIVDGHGGEIYLEIWVNRKDFCKWLSEELRQWPLLGSCLLSKWVENESPGAQADDVENLNQDGIGPKKRGERNLTKWFRETWINEGRPEGSDFFDSLKKYVNKQGSPIKEHYDLSQSGPGIRVNKGKSTDSHMTKKAVQNQVSKFKDKEKNAMAI